jgi:hypothetical protein
MVRLWCDRTKNVSRIVMSANRKRLAPRRPRWHSNGLNQSVMNKRFEAETEGQSYLAITRTMAGGITMDAELGPIIGRRAIVTAILAVAVAPAAVASPSPEEIVNQKTTELAAAMSAMHGGQWRIHIDHDAGLVAVSRRCPA